MDSQLLLSLTFFYFFYSFDINVESMPNLLVCKSLLIYVLKQPLLRVKGFLKPSGWPIHPCAINFPQQSSLIIWVFCLEDPLGNLSNWREAYLYSRRFKLNVELIVCFLEWGWVNCN